MRLNGYFPAIELTNTGGMYRSKAINALRLLTTTLERKGQIVFKTDNAQRMIIDNSSVGNESSPASFSNKKAPVITQERRQAQAAMTITPIALLFVGVQKQWHSR